MLVFSNVRKCTTIILNYWMERKEKSKIIHPETNSYGNLQTFQTKTSNDNLHCKNINRYQCSKEGISVWLKKKKKTKQI